MKEIPAKGQALTTHLSKASHYLSLMGRYRWSSLFDDINDDFAAASLEFVGTAFFLLLGLGGIQAASAESSVPRSPSATEQTLYISTSKGFSLLVSAWLFFRVMTGGLFNPNISLALLLVGSLKPVRFVLYSIAQLAGAITGAAIVRSLTSTPLAGK